MQSLVQDGVLIEPLAR